MLAHLNPLVLPEGGDLVRDPIRAAHLDVPGFAAAYDRHTLAYDAVYRPQDRAIVLVCPRLLNLAAPLRAATIRVDGSVQRISRIRRFRRFDEVWIPCPAPPSEIAVDLGGQTLAAAVSPPDKALARRDVVMVKSKDNALEWIADWAGHYGMAQGATGFLFFDNGSGTYGPADVQAVLEQAAPEAAVVVVPAPFPFGPTLPNRPKHQSKFFQAGILNVARHRFLGAAAAVLSVDIDEMIVSEVGNIFGEVRAARSGYGTIPGFWSYAQPDGDALPRHADHVWRSAKDRGCQEKWAVRPSSFLGRGGWDVHGVRGYHMNNWVQSTKSMMLHCQRITTGWKRKRQGVGDNLVPCPIATRHLADRRTEISR